MSIVNLVRFIQCKYYFKNKQIPFAVWFPKIFSLKEEQYSTDRSLEVGVMLKWFFLIHKTTFLWIWRLLQKHSCLGDMCIFLFVGLLWYCLLYTKRNKWIKLVDNN